MITNKVFEEIDMTEWANLRRPEWSELGRVCGPRYRERYQISGDIYVDVMRDSGLNHAVIEHRVFDSRSVDMEYAQV